ncbi:MAG: PDZ domain-containing protein, partial [Deltaproteobacteria bacterium]|nr:PDZ domain-containing protein [Deltaproteobacteria bacterium]
FGIKQTGGVLIAKVMADSPAEKAGLKQGDVILKMDGKKVKKVAKFRNTIALTRPGSKVELTVLRDGKKKTITVTIGALETDAKGRPVSADKLPKLGMSLQKLNAELAAQLGYKGANGVLVTAVEAGSIADRAGIKRGDLIEEVNRTAVTDPAQVKKLIKQSNKKVILLLVRQGDASRYLALKLQD